MRDTYTLKVGKGHGSERLEIVNECYNPFSLKFLEDIDLTGKTVLEVACGIGLFACELAKLVGPKGAVLATDKSQKQLDIAKENARKQKLNNIEFRVCSADELDKLGTDFDYVYARCLLGHLPDPVSVLKQELNRLKSGGYLICAEIPFSYHPLHCYPKSRAFDKIKADSFAHAKIHNTDFEIGIKLPGILKELGTSPVYSYIGQPILDTPRKKSQIRLGLYELTDLYIEKGFFTKKELEQTVEDLKKLEQSDEHIITNPSLLEICVQKK